MDEGAERRRRWIMLSWAFAFLVLALVAAFFGFGGVAASAAGIGKILFAAFLILAFVSLLSSFLRSRPV